MRTNSTINLGRNLSCIMSSRFRPRHHRPLSLTLRTRNHLSMINLQLTPKVMAHKHRPIVVNKRSAIVPRLNLGQRHQALHPLINLKFTTSHRQTLSWVSASFTKWTVDYSVKRIVCHCQPCQRHLSCYTPCHSYSCHPGPDLPPHHNL